MIAVAAVILAVLNLFSFALMAYDKRCAKAGKWRVPEKMLFLATACFGGLGGVLGMILCRHKTKHWYFNVFFPVLLAVQVVLLIVGYNMFLK
ncbi:MAG: DUF1294 domain-containing protein [Clostridia bacterium]|nr:DUF1294 domain-containing protein [Clostridia bacterium]